MNAIALRQTFAIQLERLHLTRRKRQLALGIRRDRQFPLRGIAADHPIGLNFSVSGFVRKIDAAEAPVEIRVEQDGVKSRIASERIDARSIAINPVGYRA